jgi:acetolactate decarboxylase
MEIAPDRYIEHKQKSAPAVVTQAVSQFLKLPLHSLFHVSTSGALVRGVYQRAVSVKVSRQHGDFGLGTFDEFKSHRVSPSALC